MRSEKIAQAASGVSRFIGGRRHIAGPAHTHRDPSTIYLHAIHHIIIMMQSCAHRLVNPKTQTFHQKQGTYSQQQQQQQLAGPSFHVFTFCTTCCLS
jgi:hypothetical protein